MLYGKNGQNVIYVTGRMAIPDRIAKTTWQTPENIKPRQVKYRLCKDGPKKCAACGLCAFGRWYVEHELMKQHGLEAVNG